MKSFDEYINEAGYNYIFGGTDDRNTDDKPKTFGELVEGDYFYWWEYGLRPKKCKLIDLKVEIIPGSHQTVTRLWHVDASFSNGRCMRTAYCDITGTSVWVSDKRPYKSFCAATTEEELIDTSWKVFHFKIDPTIIVDCTTAKY